MISVDFCNEPVTLIIAYGSEARQLLKCRWNHACIPICCMSWLLIDPNLALLTESRSFCLLLRTTSFASIRADFTSPFEANCFTVCLALFVAVSSCAPVNARTERQT